jgi:acyl-CoA synthetase (AMP-forming)/AMP-acid ligase II/thioesterase domain-containing protein/acyl carrier protein
MPAEISYNSLYIQAQQNADILRSQQGFNTDSPVLLRLDNHEAFLLWFWGVVLAGGIPVPLPPLSNVEEQRKKNIQHLSELFSDPICITRDELRPYFMPDKHNVKVYTLESLREQSPTESPCHTCTGPETNDPALLMMTSGSTGNPKAVCLSYTQIISAVAGKASVRQLPANKPFLNWIGLDHVASLVEIHIQAMFLGVDQIHIEASDIVASPLKFLDLLSFHQVCRSFAPNSFLASLVSTLEAENRQPITTTWDLSHLTVLASGGETNDVRTCVAASELFAAHGAPRNVITPGFGMTETCAGAIFNLDCPAFDIKTGKSFTSVGRCMEGIEMRVQSPNTNPTSPDSVGHLEVRGDVVFSGYYRNKKATEEALTPDGWFRTGDLATIDSTGSLYIIGRITDSMNINGVKYNCEELEASLLQNLHSRLRRLMGFSFRPEGLHTEHVAVVYVPKELNLQDQDFIYIHDTIVQATILSTGARPQVFAPETDCISASSLGKVSRVRMRKLLESGAFTKNIASYEQRLKTLRKQNIIEAKSSFEALLLEDVTGCLGIKPGDIGLNTPFFDLGMTSMDLIRLKKRISERLDADIPIITLMKSPTVGELAVALRESDPCTRNTYNPVMTLRSKGANLPLWLVHPGVGEVLVFLGLSKEIDDRPVYALRARGFEAGEAHFANISEIVATYFDAIKRVQPQGPYAIAGYSYGAMLAFEVSKKLESNGDEIGFLGSFNLPPHIKSRMRQLTWNSCLLHLMNFLDLVTESVVEDLDETIQQIPRGEAIPKLLAIADTGRITELGLDERSLSNWANLAYGLQSVATTYEPSGSVNLIDIFHCIPLKMAAKSREDWLNNHLSKWSDFSRTEPRFHSVDGSHYTMIGADHVVVFAKTLRVALRERGV